MWKNVPVYLEDLQHIAADSNIPWHELDGKTVLVTGATGLIGSNIVNALLYYGEKAAAAPRVLALVRNEEKARRIFGDQLAEHGEQLSFIVGDVCNPVEIKETVDYIIHAASETASRSFVDHPVETIHTAVAGTWNMLELAKEKKVQAFVYLSSMEVYGTPKTEEAVDELSGTNLDTMQVRSSYPTSKRMCESLCTSCYSEYGVPAKVVRLTQTFGPGIDYQDQRVFAEFTRCAMEKRDIILHTDGSTKRNYLYTRDAVTAILTILLKGENGKAYNAANEKTFCSIWEMANLVSSECANGTIGVQIEIKENRQFGYAPTLKMNLRTGRLNELGWKATVDLAEMYQRVITAIQQTV